MSKTKQQRLSMEEAKGSSTRNVYTGNNANYTVKKGDTLSAIAKANNMNLADLIKDNAHITNPDSIYTGNQLYIRNRTTSSEPSSIAALKRSSNISAQVGQTPTSQRTVQPKVNNSATYYPESAATADGRRTLKDTRPGSQRILNSIFGSSKKKSTQNTNKSNKTTTKTYYPKSATTSSSKQVERDTRSRWDRFFGF